MKRLPLVASFLLFIALCASAAYWGMQLFKPPLRQVAAPPRTAPPEIRAEAASGLFGGRRANVAVASNYQLKGVIFSGSPRDSVAILSADGNAAQAVRVNSEVAPGVTVKEVHRGYVLLSEGGVTKRVELPDDAKAQGGMNVAPAAPNRPAAPTSQRPPIPPRTSTVPGAPSAMPPPTPAPAPVPQATIPPPIPGQPAPQMQSPSAAQAPGQVPAQAPGQVPGQVAGQVPGQVPGQAPVTGVPPTVVVSPPPGGQAGAVPGAAPMTTPQAGVPGMPSMPQQPQAVPGTTTVPGMQQPVPGAPVTR